MTASLDLDLSSSEREAIEEMKRRVSKDLPRKVYDEAALYYRFLKARDFDVDAAETMLRNTLQWRKDNNIDKILTDYKRPEALAKYLDKLLLGYDKEGCPYFYIAVGKYDVRGIHMAAKYPDIEKAIVHVVEEGEKLLDKQSKKLGKTLIGFINIIDVDGLTFGNATYKKVRIETVIRLLKLQQDNYPERMKNFFIINASSLFTLPFSIIKNFLNTRMLAKFHVYGTEGWQEELLNLIDADNLPTFLGGSLKDPDGSPLCKTFVNHGFRVNEKYYQHKSVNSLEKSPGVKKITLPRASFSEVEVKIDEPGSIIEWEFETKTRDIGFGLFYKEVDGEEETMKELVALQRLETEDFSETGMYRCEKEWGVRYII